MYRRILMNRYVIALLFFVISAVVIVVTAVNRSRAGHPHQFGIGRPARPEEISRLDLDVRPDGKGLPTGRGKIASGKLIYEAKCIACHGDGGKTESPLLGEALFLNGGKISPDKGERAPKSIGTYWPYATTIFDYVRRAMPYNAPGSLSNQEVYDLTAYLLYRNHIIPDNTVITEKSLPKIVMPARSKFVEDDRKGGAELK
jgi:hypothetical protein